MKYDRIYNFSAGPSILPEEVLESVRDNLMNYEGSGMCVMEMSHRSKVFQKIIDEAEQDLLHTYNRYQVVLDRGDGVSLYDIEGKRYLDFVAGIAVFALGYHNAGYNDALKAQIDKVIHLSLIHI